jgi:hypothetical protein
VSAAAASPAAGPAAGRSETLVSGVVVSLFTLIEANTDNPEGPIALGDEVVFHDQLFSNGQHVGDDVGSCVVVALGPGLPGQLQRGDQGAGRQHHHPVRHRPRPGPEAFGADRRHRHLPQHRR